MKGERIMAGEYGMNIVTLVDDEGNQMEFEVLDAIETDDGRYIALLPIPEAGSESDGEYFILQVVSGDGQDELIEVEDSELMETLADIFEGRFEELYGGE